MVISCVMQSNSTLLFVVFFQINCSVCFGVDLPFFPEFQFHFVGFFSHDANGMLWAVIIIFILLRWGLCRLVLLWKWPALCKGIKWWVLVPHKRPKKPFYNRINVPWSSNNNVNWDQKTGDETNISYIAFIFLSSIFFHFYNLIIVDRILYHLNQTIPESYSNWSQQIQIQTVFNFEPLLFNIYNHYNDFERVL